MDGECMSGVEHEDAHTHECQAAALSPLQLGTRHISHSPECLSVGVGVGTDAAAETSTVPVEMDINAGNMPSPRQGLYQCLE